MMYNRAGVAPLVILHELKDKELFSYPQQGYVGTHKRYQRISEMSHPHIDGARLKHRMR